MTLQLPIFDRLTPIIDELMDSGITLAQAVDAFENKFVIMGLARLKGNVTQAARLLGVHRNTLHNKRPVTPRLLRSRALRQRRTR